MARDARIATVTPRSRTVELPPRFRTVEDVDGVDGPSLGVLFTFDGQLLNTFGGEPLVLL